MRKPVALLYPAMLGGTVSLFLLIRSLGNDLVAPEASGPWKFGNPAAFVTAETLLPVLLALVVIIVAARLVGAVFRHLHQPAVIGEMIAGILLGPSLLGRVAPDVYAYLLSASVAPFLGVIAQVGVILYMFLVGLGLDTGSLTQRTHASIAVSHASIVVPFLLGAGLALWLYPRLSTRDVPFTVFALFMGVSMSVTAFPVLARILTDTQMHKSQMGAIALTCAAVDDVTAWCLLAFVVGVAQAEPGRVLITVALTAAFIAAIFLLVRPAALWFVREHASGRWTGQGTMTIACMALLLAALSTEYIGIHALFGAFLVGAVVPHDTNFAREVTQKLEDLVVVLLLPAFFAFTGMRTQIGLLCGLNQWLIFTIIVLVASGGKFGGSAIAARLTGLEWPQAATLGILMNTRGLMELIVLNVGLDLGVLSPTLFAMLVLMAVITTLATTPLLHVLKRTTEGRGRDGGQASLTK